jgi:hypothetical protein
MSRTAAPVMQRIARAEPRGLSRIDAAAYVGIGTTTGKMPRPFRLEGRVIYDRRRLDAAIDDMQDDPNPANIVWDDVG